MQSSTTDSPSTDTTPDAALEGSDATAPAAENAENTATAASVEEVENVIAELETYRQRLVDETMDIARKIKLPKKAAQAQVDNHPEIAKITQMIQGLRDRQGNTAAQ